MHPLLIIGVLLGIAVLCTTMAIFITLLVRKPHAVMRQPNMSTTTSYTTKSQLSHADTHSLSPLSLSSTEKGFHSANRSWEKSQYSCSSCKEIMPAVHYPPSYPTLDIEPALVSPLPSFMSTTTYPREDPMTLPPLHEDRAMSPMLSPAGRYSQPILPTIREPPPQRSTLKTTSWYMEPTFGDTVALPRLNTSLGYMPPPIPDSSLHRSVSVATSRASRTSRASKTSRTSSKRSRRRASMPEPSTPSSPTSTLHTPIIEEAVALDFFLPGPVDRPRTGIMDYSPRLITHPGRSSHAVMV